MIGGKVQGLSTVPRDIPQESKSELTNQNERPGVRKNGKRRAKTINDLRAYMTEMVEQENERKGDVACHVMVRPPRAIAIVFKRCHDHTVE